MRSTVRTWADSCGVWHARVSFAGLPYVYDTVATRTKARRAIRHEIWIRSNGYDKLGPVHIELVEVKKNEHGQIMSVEYREKV